MIINTKTTSQYLLQPKSGGKKQISRKVDNHFIVRVCCVVCGIWTTSCVTFKITEPLNQPHDRIKTKAARRWEAQERLSPQHNTSSWCHYSLSKISILWLANTFFNWKNMSGRTGSSSGSSNSVIQAQKLVDQLRVEAGMERIKVRTSVNRPSISACFQ